MLLLPYGIKDAWRTAALLAPVHGWAGCSCSQTVARTHRIGGMCDVLRKVRKEDKEEGQGKEEEEVTRRSLALRSRSDVMAGKKKTKKAGKAAKKKSYYRGKEVLADRSR